MYQTISMEKKTDKKKEDIQLSQKTFNIFKLKKQSYFKSDCKCLCEYKILDAFFSRLN